MNKCQIIFLMNKRNKPVPEPSKTSNKTGETNLYYRRITDNLPIIIWITNQDSQCVYLNNRWYEYTGEKVNNGFGFEWMNIVHPEDRLRTKEIFLEANKNQVIFSFEYRLKSKD